MFEAVAESHDLLLVGSRIDGGFGADDPDGLGTIDRFADPFHHRVDHVHHHRPFPHMGFHLFEGIGGGRVAGNHDHLAILLKQKVSNPQGVSHNGLLGLIPVWQVGRIAEIDQLFGRQQCMQGMGHGQSAHPRIK